MGRHKNPSRVAEILMDDCDVLAVHWRQFKSPQAKEAIQRLADIVINWIYILEE